MASYRGSLWMKSAFFLALLPVLMACLLWNFTSLGEASLASRAENVLNRLYPTSGTIIQTTSSRGPVQSLQPQEPELSPEAFELVQTIFQAARNGEEDILRQTLDAGLPVNLMNEKGNTLLMIASYSGHPSTVRLLLSRGADPNRVNDRNQTPLGAAVFKLEKEVVKVLLDGGADVWAGKPSAADLAGMVGDDEMFLLLGIERKGD